MESFFLCMQTCQSVYHQRGRCDETYNQAIQGRKCGGVWGGGSPPQRNDPVGLKLSAVGLKIMRLFTRGALRSKLNI
jgi:hypothetical protein